MLSTVALRMRPLTKICGIKTVIRCLSSSQIQKSNVIKHRQKDVTELLNAYSTSDQSTDLPTFVNCRQGEKTGSIFSSQEMENRLKKLRQKMVENNIDVCIFTSYHNICYYSEFLFCKFGRPYALVVTLDDQTSVAANTS